MDILLSEYLKKTFERILEYSLTIIEAVSGSGKSTAVYAYFLEKVARKCRQLSYTCLGELRRSHGKVLARSSLRLMGRLASIYALHGFLIRS